MIQIKLSPNVNVPQRPPPPRQQPPTPRQPPPLPRQQPPPPRQQPPPPRQQPPLPRQAPPPPPQMQLPPPQQSPQLPPSLPPLEEKILTECVILDSHNALSVTMGSAYSMQRCFMNRIDCWHKFIILNGSTHDKEFVLKMIMDAVYPVCIIPVMYKEDGVDSWFLARNCCPAIERLCRSSLMIDIPNGPSLKLRIVLAHALISEIQLNMQENLVKVIDKRFNRRRKHLDLSNYHRDADLSELIFCPLSQTKILHYVLNTVKSCLLTNVNSLNLSYNDLRFLKSLEALWQLPTIYKLDLRHNLINNVTDLEVLRPMQVSEIWLDQNPLCQSFDNEYQYANSVREVLPSIVKLDGVLLGPAGFPRTKRNFIMSSDDVNLTDQFIRHYFTLYDSDFRKKLAGLYHNDALFSLTSTYLPAQSTSNTARLTEYTIESRNLLKLSDYTKSTKLLYHGSDAIIATICKLPRSEHYRFSFTVDCVHSAFNIVITVCGVFREPSTVKSPLIRSFCRVFVLIKVAPQEFQIINETLHIKNATTKEAEEAFKITPPDIPSTTSEKSVNYNESDKKKMTEVLCQLSEMNPRWSGKCLEETKWDIKEALIVFTELYKQNRIPPEAFANT